MTEYFINGSEVLNAVHNWNKVMNGGKTASLHQGPHRFSTFIGKHKLVADSRYGWRWKVTEPTYNKIMILASPHHYALLKVFKAKTGWQGKIP